MIEFFMEAIPVLFANLITVAFIYACWITSRAECNPNVRKSYIGGYCGIVAILAFVLLGMLIYR